MNSIYLSGLWLPINYRRLTNAKLLSCRDLNTCKSGVQGRGVGVGCEWEREAEKRCFQYPSTLEVLGGEEESVSPTHLYLKWGVSDGKNLSLEGGGRMAFLIFLKRKRKHLWWSYNFEVFCPIFLILHFWRCPAKLSQERSNYKIRPNCSK